MTRHFLILPLILACLSPLAIAQQAPDSACPCTLKGLVLNSVTGAPIRNALVESNLGSPNSTLSDSDGAFHFDNLPSGSATLSAVKPGFLPFTPFLTSSSAFRVAPDAPPAVLKLVPGGVVRGHISDDQGIPLENFTVELLQRLPGSSESSQPSFKYIVTNDLGNFRIPDLPAGAYYLVVAPQEAHGYLGGLNENPVGYPEVYYPGVLDQSAATPIKVSAGRESVANFTLSPKPFIRLSGRVSGYPPGSSPQLFMGGAANPEDPQAAQSIKFDSRTGTFQTGWIPPGTHSILAFAQGDTPSVTLAAHLVVSASSSVSDLNLVMAPGVTLSVSVEGTARREDVSQLSVQLTDKGTGQLAVAEAATDDSEPNLPPADMYFTFLAQGAYHLEISFPASAAYYVESAKFGSTDLLAGDLVVDSSSSAHPIEITVRQGAATVSGTVNFKDAARGAVVCLFPEKPNAKQLIKPARNNGSFQFDGLPPGSYRIAAVDSFLDVDFSNPESLKKISSTGSEISLAPSQALNLTLDLVAVEE